MHNLGSFFGEIVKAIKTDPTTAHTVEIARTQQSQPIQTPLGPAVATTRTVDEVAVTPPKNDQPAHVTRAPNDGRRSHTPRPATRRTPDQPASMNTWHRHPSPIGELLLTAEDGSLTGLYTPEHKRAAVGSTPDGAHDPAPFEDICRQLDAYFAGTLRAFEATTRPAGTPFQHQVWDYLMTIPFGQTRTYQDIAKFIGSPDSVRAVGAANGANPLSIIVPCHRVIAKGGALQGYAGGLNTKQWLLDHEARFAGTTLLAV